MEDVSSQLREVNCPVLANVWFKCCTLEGIISIFTPKALINWTDKLKSPVQMLWHRDIGNHVFFLAPVISRRSTQQLQYSRAKGFLVGYPAID